MDALKLPFTFDVARLQADVAQLTDNDFRESNSRYVKRDTYYLCELIDAIPGEFHPEGHPKFGPKPVMEKLPYLSELEAFFPGIKESFRVNRLLPGAEIRDHRDFLLNYENGHIRVHVPIIAPEGSVMHFPSGPATFREGECWYGNYAVNHNTANQHDIDRYHLVMDVIPNDWWHEQMKKAGFPQPTN